MLNSAYCFILKGLQDPNFMQEVNKFNPGELLFFLTGLSIVAACVFCIFRCPSVFVE